MLSSSFYPRNRPDDYADIEGLRASPTNGMMANIGSFSTALLLFAFAKGRVSLEDER